MAPARASSRRRKETLAQAFWERLRPELPDSLLRTVRSLWETDKNWAEFGVEAWKLRPHPGPELRSRYTAADVGVFTPDEARRFVPRGDGDPHDDVDLAWELLYRLEPELYDRLATAERLHPGVIGWLPRDVGRIAEIGSRRGP